MSGIPGLHADLGLVTVAPKSSAAGLLICTRWFRYTLRFWRLTAKRFVLSYLTPNIVVVAARFSREVDIG